MTMKGIGRSAREVLLTFGALLGVLCIVATIAGIAFGVKPLVFRSGSMAPAIHTGDLAVSRTVDASTLKAGDIVSVVNSEGNRVTHRLVNVASQGSARQLTLRGDANKTADSEVYTVTRAERVLFDIPKAGYVVNAVASPIGLFALGAFVTAMLLLAFRRHDRGGGPTDGPTNRRRKGGTRKADSKRGRTATRSVATAVFAASLAVAAPASAAPWTDPVALEGVTYAAHTVLPPISSTCTVSSPNVTIAWPEKDPLYDYEVVLKRQNGSEVSTGTVTGAGVSQTYQALGDFGFGLLAIGTYDFTVEVRSYLAASPLWRSASVLVAAKKIRISVVSVLFIPVLGSVSCV